MILPPVSANRILEHIYICEDRAQQGRTGEDTSRTRQEQDRTGQDKIAKDRAGQGRSGQGKTGQGRAG